MTSMQKNVFFSSSYLVAKYTKYIFRFYRQVDSRNYQKLKKIFFIHSFLIPLKQPFYKPHINSQNFLKNNFCNFPALNFELNIYTLPLPPQRVSEGGGRNIDFTP